MPYKDKEKARQKSREWYAASLEDNRKYHREYARAKKAGIPWVNPVPKPKQDRTGIATGTRYDITGKKFGELTALRYVKTKTFPKSHGKEYIWEFECDCGSIVEKNRNNVTQGKVTRCGRCKTGRYLTYEESARRQMLNSYVKRSARDGRTFTLGAEEFNMLINSSCAICGLPPSQAFNYHKYTLMYTGVDRIDNEIGYESSNVRPCCKVCNQAKHAMSEEEFQSWVIRIINFRKTESPVVDGGGK